MLPSGLDLPGHVSAAGLTSQIMMGQPGCRAGVLAMLENSMFFLTAVHLDTHGTRQKSGAGEMEATMRWYHYVAYFFGGAFLANTLPHLGNGISGHPFQSPFASPPGEGLSSSTVNVLWGLFNLAVGYLLVCRVGRFDLRRTRHVLVLGAGIVFISVMLARGFGRFHGGL
jgi:hypothetical protein